MDNSYDLLRQLTIEREPPAPVKRRIAIVPIALVATAAAIACLGGWLWTRPSPVPVHVAVVAAAARNNVHASVLDATGYISARRVATVSSKVTGKVTAVLIEEGQHVEAGQIMARLDPLDADLQKRQAGAQLAASRSQLTAVQAQLRQAQSDTERNRQLADRKFISPIQLDQSVVQRDVLLAQVDTASHNVELASEQLAAANNGLDSTIVRAPFAGVVIAKAAQVGEIISPLSAGGGYTRTGIATLVDMNSLEIEVNINEAYIGRIAQNMAVEARLNAYPEWPIAARVIAVVPTADRNKATVKVRIALDSKDARIVPDMGIKVSFLDAAKSPAKAAGVVRVANSAVVKIGGQAFVYVLGPSGQALERPVRLGPAGGEDSEVLAGLANGESVVLDPPPGLRDGALVRIAANADSNH